MPVKVSSSIGVAAVGVLAILSSPGTAVAGELCCCVANGYTHYMWSRTWHAQNSVTMPVNPYFVPRSPGDCRNGAYYGSGGSVTGVGGGEPNHYGAYPYAPGAAVGFEPLQSERLGKIPNEMSMGSLLQPMPAGQPVGPAPRR